jgi:GNAT superfamily N-acetyltransferase
MARPVTGETLPVPLGGHRFSVEASGTPGRFDVVRVADQRTVGRAVLREPEPGTVFIESLCIDEEHRGYGAGSEAAELILGATAEAGMAVRAWAPPHLGLAVYFWVRMGLSPLHGEGPDGGLWFERRS